MAIRQYELTPADERKSFYGKASVLIDETNNEYLLSYRTIVAIRANNGKLFRCWEGYNGAAPGFHSATTTRHIKAFCGLDRKQYEKLPDCDVLSI